MDSYTNHMEWTSPDLTMLGYYVPQELSETIINLNLKKSHDYADWNVHDCKGNLTMRSETWINPLPALT
jgi:hypothetical protein